MNNIDLLSLVSELARSPIQEHYAILTSRTMWFGRVINYFKPQNEIDVHSTINKIQDFIEKDLSVLQQPAFIRDAIELTNKLDTYVSSRFECNPNFENEKCLSFIFSFESYILTHISGNQAKNLEVMHSIQSRLVPENVISYLVSANFSQNITLAIACCSYIEKEGMIGRLKEYLTKKPEKTLDLLNAGCLAKSDFVIKVVWEIICLNKNFKIFKEDKRLTSALDYLINKEEYSNQTLIVGNLQNLQTVLVNREVLAQRNAYFNGLFQTDFAEASQSAIMLKDQDHTKLQGIDDEGFLYLLRYIYTGDIDVPLELCLSVSRLADIYLEPDLKKTCDKKKWDQAVLGLKNMNLVGKFQSANYEKFFYFVHYSYTGKTDVFSVIMCKDLDIEKLQELDYTEILYLLHYIYTGEADIPLEFCLTVSRLADAYSEPDLKKICDKKKWNQATLTLKDKGLLGKFQEVNYERLFYLIHEIYTGQANISSITMLKEMNHIEKLQGIDYQEILYLLHYLYTGDKDVPLALCLGVSYLADIYSEPDLKEVSDQKILQAS